MAPQNRYDLVILGSGSTAFAAALRARELGRTAALTAEDDVPVLRNLEPAEDATQDQRS